MCLSKIFGGAHRFKTPKRFIRLTRLLVDEIYKSLKIDNLHTKFEQSDNGKIFKFRVIL